MKWISFLSILSLALQFGCSEKQIAEPEEAKRAGIKKIERVEPDIQIRSSAEPAAADFLEIRDKADLTDDVDEFVAWLKTRTNVSNVVHTKLMYLASNPPKQVVNFKLDNIPHRLVFTIGIDKTFKLL